MAEAKCWKNGVATSLPGLSRASSIVLKTNDVYIGGAYTSGSTILAGYLKNSTLTKLEETYPSVVNGMAVVK